MLQVLTKLFLQTDFALAKSIFAVAMPAIFKIYQRGVYAHRETFFDTKQVTWVKNAAKSTYQMKGQARQMFKSNEFILKNL